MDKSSKQRNGLSCSEAGKLGALKSKATHNLKKQKNIEFYLDDPNLCLHCESVLPYDKRKNKFCSYSCAASHNNLGNRKHGQAPKICPECGNVTKSSHFVYCSNKCRLQNKYREDYKLLCDDSLPESITAPTIRKIMIRSQKHECEICKRSEWDGQPIPLIMDHINGCADDNRFENLRLICPNCDALLPTYKAKNRNSSRQYRRKRYAEGKTY